MSCRLEIEKGEDFVHTRVYGELTPAAVEQVFKETAAKAAEWGFRKFYVDLRKAVRNIGTVDDYYFAFHGAESAGFKRGSRHVLLVSPDDRPDQWDFVQTVFTNAGYTINVVTDEAQALALVKR